MRIFVLTATYELRVSTVEKATYVTTLNQVQHCGQRQRRLEQKLRRQVKTTLIFCCCSNWLDTKLQRFLNLRYWSIGGET
jgi:hypothetical protein